MARIPVAIDRSVSFRFAKLVVVRTIKHFCESSIVCDLDFDEPARAFSILGKHFGILNRRVLVGYLSMSNGKIYIGCGFDGLNTNDDLARSVSAANLRQLDVNDISKCTRREKSNSKSTLLQTSNGPRSLP